jgi:archaemetzincin
MATNTMKHVNQINLISFGITDKALLEMLRAETARIFSCKVNHKEARTELGQFFDGTRRQYNADSLLQMVDQNYSKAESKTLGLFQVDLFIPILTYIFGQAYLNGRSAVASGYRLVDERYGIKTNRQNYPERFLKEVIHELGHNFGLIHCRNIGCVMQASTYVEDIDLKNADFCPVCRKQLEQ